MRTIRYSTMNACPAAHLNPNGATRPTPGAGLPAAVDTLSDVVERLTAGADRPAIVAMTASGSRTIMRGELHREVRQLAGALRSTRNWRGGWKAWAGRSASATA